MDYQTDLFVADIPESVDITTAFSGNGNEYPEPPNGITIRRLTHSGKIEGIVRGSFDGEMIAFISPDKSGVLQVFVINSKGSDLSGDKKLKSHSTFKHSNQMLPRLAGIYKRTGYLQFPDGNVFAVCAETGKNFGKTLMLTDDDQEREELVVSNDGNILAYSILKTGSDKNETKKFRQIFVMELDWGKITSELK